MTRLRFCLLALLALGAACAAPRYPGPGGPPAPEEERARALRADEQELHRQEAELGGLGAQDRPVDCARAFVLRDNICALSARICTLAEGLPHDPNAPARCTDARTRCQAARARVAAACPEPPGR